MAQFNPAGHTAQLAGLCIVAAISLGACGNSEPEQAAATSPATQSAAKEEMLVDLGAQLNTRSAEDRARDAGRRPAEVLTLLGIEPGMSVIDLMAAGGWYTEVIAHAVGAEGSVTAQNPPWLLQVRDGAMDKALDKRLNNRLANVSRLNATWDELGQTTARYDAAISALNLHDAYYMESPEAAAGMLSAVYAILEPGGVFGVIDHAGNVDGDNKSLHRIDKGLALELATATGFTVEVDSDLLSSSTDDHTQNVFAEGMRGQTDRFLLKLRKPAD